MYTHMCIYTTYNRRHISKAWLFLLFLKSLLLMDTNLLILFKRIFLIMGPWSFAKKKYLGQINVFHSCSSNSCKLNFRNWIILTPYLENPSLEPWHCLLKCFTAEVFWSLSTCVSYKGMPVEKNRIGWYSRPFQAYIYIFICVYIINKLYRSQDGISKSLVVTIYFSWQGREFDWFLSWYSKFCRDGSHHEAKQLQRNKKMSFHTSQTLLLPYKYQILEYPCVCFKGKLKEDIQLSSYLLKKWK